MFGEEEKRGGKGRRNEEVENRKEGRLRGGEPW